MTTIAGKTTNVVERQEEQGAQGRAQEAWQWLVRTEAGVSPVILRLGLAVVLFPHGAQKLLGWFGGGGFEGTMSYMTGVAGLPWIVALLVILGEFFGPLMLAAGAATRFAAASLGVIMLGAIFMGHLEVGFFMNWSGQQAGEGFEYHILAIAIALALTVRGAGSWSVDRLATVKAANRG